MTAEPTPSDTGAPETGFSSRRILLYSLLFFSGAAGLSYELVWTRQVGYFFGHTVYAMTTVLAAFMGGLALGGYAFGRLADRTKHPLRLYALLELGIGASCLAAPMLLSLARELYLAASPSLLGQALPRTLLQFILILAALLVPTTLMGGTIPVVVRGLVGRPGSTGGTVALLYGINTVGAAAGVIAAGYVLLPGIGIRATNNLGAAVSLAVGLLGLAFFRNVAVSRREETVAVGQRQTTLEQVLLAGLFLSGAVGMTCQIAWVRALILVIGSSTYALSAILVTFLIGLALGSLIFSRLARPATPALFAALQGGIALGAVLLIPFFNHLPRLFLALFRGYQGDFGYILLIQFLVVLPFVLIPTTLMGMAFPCVAGILSRDPNRAGRDVGRSYAFNTAGAIAGSVAAGFFLIPVFGAQRTLAAAIGVSLLVAAAVLAASRSCRLTFLIPGLAAGLLLPFLLPAWDRALMSSGVAANPHELLRQSGANDGRPLADIENILFFREGISTTIAVTGRLDGDRQLRVNGKTDAGTNPVDMPTQVNLAFVPLAIHPAPRRVAVVGLGSGITAGVAALFETIERIDVVELEPAVLDAARLFSRENFGVLADPRLFVTIDDARSFLQGSAASFDVVISEPSNPWIAGVASLFSAEFMGIVRDRLAPGGIYCQWLQAYSISPEETRMIVRTFLSVFPDASLWIGSPVDFLIVGRKGGAGPVDARTLMERLRGNRRLDGELTRLGLNPAENLWSSFRLGPAEMRAYGGSGTLNTDDLLTLEFQAPKSLYLQQTSTIEVDLLSLKTKNHPAFVDAPFLDDPSADLRLGKYLLLRRRLPREAAWHFARVPALPPFGERPESADLQRANATDPTGVFREDFAGGPWPLLVPHIGYSRPQDVEGDSYSLWNAYRLLFTRISGILAAAGRDGSAGLVITSLQDVNYAGIAIPLAVRPSTSYEVSFWMASHLTAGEAVVGTVEYDVAELSPTQFTADFDREHAVAGEVGLRIGESHPWKLYRFSFHTAAQTRMVHLVFSREGQPDPAPIFVDDIEVKQIAPPRGGG